MAFKCDPHLSHISVATAIPSTQNSILLPFFTLKILLIILQGHPQMLPASWSLPWPSVPSCLSKPRLAEACHHASCLCLLWLWALGDWKCLWGSSVEETCPLHRTPLNKFLLKTSTKENFAPTDVFACVPLSDSETVHGFPLLPQPPGSLALIYSNHLGAWEHLFFYVC